MKIPKLIPIAVALFVGGAAHSNDLETAIQKGFDAGKLPGLHSVIVRQRGETLAEVYFKGKDQRWGWPTGVREHGPETLHDLRSVSKSMTSLLYGIALADDLVPAPDTSLFAAFADYADLSNPEREAITLENVLSMQMGIEWDENRPYTDPRNSEIAMERAPDRVRFVLDRPIVGKPGQGWTYNGGATALLGELIARGTGMALDDYAKQKLFTPLGITDFDWVKGSDGKPAAASGLRLRAPDLAKIGDLIANDGVYKGRHIVPAKWLEASFEPRAKTKSLRYGYQWWLAPQGSPPIWVAGLGNGGQRVSINPSLGLVVVVFAGNYNQPDAWKVPVSVITDYVIPELGLR